LAVAQLGDRSVTDLHHLINWTIEETRLLKAEQPQRSDEGPIIPSLDQILIWPEGDPPGRPAEPVDSITRSAPIQSPSETAPIVPPSNDAEAATEPKATNSPVSVFFSISADVRTEEPKAPPATAVVEADTHATPADRDRMIALRWILRDIRSNRLKWSPVSQHDLRTLIVKGFIEMRDGTPVLTNEGNRAIE
jgi:hypothetical protein